MKNLLIILAACCGVFAGRVLAQQTPTSVNYQEKMKAFSGWVGRWQGEGAMQTGPGEPRKSQVDERIESKLDGTMLLIEGKGVVTDPATKQETIVHHAMAILSYDATTDSYKFNTHLKDGKSADAWMKVLGENKYQWGFDTSGTGKVRYTITLVQNTWNEIGEFTQDGTTYRKFFEMNLKKTE